MLPAPEEFPNGLGWSNLGVGDSSVQRERYGTSVAGLE